MTISGEVHEQLRARAFAIDELRSARVRRHVYVGEWLPEPLVADETRDPARGVEVAESLSLAFLAPLETLCAATAVARSPLSHALCTAAAASPARSPPGRAPARVAVRRCA